MSDQKKTDGGPAFPIYGKLNEWGYAEQPGMTLRDYFAAKAMVGILQDWTEVVRDAMAESTTSERIKHLAKRSYDIADAMLKAREQ